MKYTIAYTEIIPRIQEVEAENEREAIHKLLSMVYQGTTQEKLTGLACNHEIVDVRSENGDAFCFFNKKLVKYRTGKNREEQKHDNNGTD